MSVMWIAMPVAFLLASAALYACIRCLRAGQFDDMETPPLRMLADDEPGVRR